jgi:hypothetical protein
MRGPEMNDADFTRLFPEFAQTDAVLRQAKLLEAATRMGGPDATVWGPFAAPGTPPFIADTAQGNLAAHYLIASPFGGPTRLNPKSGRSTYLDKYEELERIVGLAQGPVVSGSLPGAPPGAITTQAVFLPGLGTVAVTNGSTAITFVQPQTMMPGTLLEFASQGGGVYSLASAILNGTSGTLAAPYNGVSNPTTSWTHCP